MPAYLGPSGSLVEFKCSTTVSEDRPTSSRRTMGGLVKVQRGKLSRRTWDVDVSTASPAEIASLAALLQGGTPPWVYVDPYAQVTNLYTPEQSVLMPGTWDTSVAFLEGGSVTVDGLTLPRSVNIATANTIRFGYVNSVKKSPAAMPGVRVYASAYLRGTGNLVLTYQDYSGASVGSASLAYNNATLARSSVSGIPPAGTASVQFNASGCLQAAGPSITWTDTLADWSVGRGCLSSVSEGLSEAVQMAVRESNYLRRSQVSFTIREIG